jgi:two-component system sensor kinase FixL
MIVGRENDNIILGEISQLQELLAEKEREIGILKMSYLFLGTLFDGISEDIMVLDPDFNIKDVNRAFLERYGLKRGDVLGRKCYDIKERSGGPCNTQGAPCPLRRAMKTAQRVEMTHSHTVSKGHIKESVLIMYPIKSEDGEIEYFLEIARDVTEYRTMIRKLQASEKRFRAILDTATDAIISMDEDQKIILFNDAAQRIFGYSREEIIGEELDFLIPPQHGDDYRILSRVLQTREPDILRETMSMNGRRSNGEEFPIELGLSFLEMDGGVTYTAIIRDVFHQRQLERKLLQSERLAAVGQAVAHVAHELRNPLMIIGGFSNQILRDPSDGKTGQKLEMILEEVARLEKLVAELGDFTKDYRLVKRPADINLVVKDVLKIMSGVYSSEKHKFEELLSPAVGEINCDPDKLRQVLINIVSNGIEAMADGGLITVNTEKVPDGIEVRITDEGTGIKEEELQQIFEPFYTTRERGSGLGLSISYRIIEAHEGDLSAVSRPGEGTTFIIRLPAV